MQQTSLHNWHASQGARMVDFAGWHMPVQYTSIVEEHKAVRSAAGLFDIAHMGRLKFTGPDSCRFLDFVTTNDVTRLKVGDIRYALVCNESGGVLDDVLVYRFADCYMLVVNASNRPKIVDWLSQHQSEFDVQIEDQTESHFMLALQGPAAIAIAATVTGEDPAQLRYYTGHHDTAVGQPAIVTRTGYTGEDGVEIIINANHANELWHAVVDAGTEKGLKPAGLGCRDTLRLEAAMPLYGHELSETIDPLTAGLSFAVKLKAGDFIGKAALATLSDQTDRKVRVGLQLEGRRIAREGAIVLVGETTVGEVTSGTFSPTLEQSIAVAYVNSDCSATSTSVEVDIRGKRQSASVVPLPFYRRAES